MKRVWAEGLFTQTHMYSVCVLVFTLVSVQLVANAYQLIKIIAYFSAFCFSWPSSREFFALGFSHTLLC